MVEGVLLTRLEIVSATGGAVLKAMKGDDPGASGFGEAYFSIVEKGAVKAWKRHRKMTLNLIVPCGEIRFVIYDDRPESRTCGSHEEVRLSLRNYQRLTIPPMLWMGFQGGSEQLNMLLNLADMAHDPAEADRLDPREIAFDWSSYL